MGGMVRQDLSVVGMELCEGSGASWRGWGWGWHGRVWGAQRGDVWSWGDGGEDELSM